MTNTTDQVTLLAIQAATRITHLTDRLGGEIDSHELTEDLTRVMSRPNSYGKTMYVRFDLPGVWGAEVTVTVKMTVVETAEMRGMVASRLQTTASIGWSSTDRSIADAVATVALYQRAIEFASVAQAVLSFEISRRSK